MKRFLTVMAMGLALIFVVMAWPSASRIALARQDEAAKTKKKAEPKAAKISEALKQEGGRIIDEHRPDADVQHQRGNLYRPMLPSGGGGVAAVEEGMFTLRPGDLLELECAIPDDRAAHLSFQVEDEKVLKLLPTGVRKLVPMSMIGGEPKPITGLERYTSLFQAQDEGETIVRLTLGKQQFQYRIKVGNAGDAPGDRN